MPDTNPKPQSTVSEIEKRWTKPLVEAGWTAIPSVIFERQAALGLDSLDINIILHLAGYWWTDGNAPRPSKSRLAAAIGVDPRTVQRHIANLEKARFIKRTARSSRGGGSKPNEYSLAGLIVAATPFAEERIEEKKRRQAEAVARARRKRPLSAVK